MSSVTLNIKIKRKFTVFNFQQKSECLSSVLEISTANSQFVNFVIQNCLQIVVKKIAYVYGFYSFENRCNHHLFFSIYFVIKFAENLHS